MQYADNSCLGNQGMALNFVSQQEIHFPVPTMLPGAMSLKGGWRVFVVQWALLVPFAAGDIAGWAPQRQVLARRGVFFPANGKQQKEKTAHIHTATSSLACIPSSMLDRDLLGTAGLPSFSLCPQNPDQVWYKAGIGAQWMTVGCMTGQPMDGRMHVCIASF